MRYHIYWQDKILLKDLDEEEFKNIWEKMHWVYNKELNYVEVGEHILEEHSCWVKDTIYLEIMEETCPLLTVVVQDLCMLTWVSHVNQTLTVR